MPPMTAATIKAESALALVCVMPLYTRIAARPLTRALSSTPTAPMASTRPTTATSKPPSAFDTFSEASVFARSISFRNKPETSLTRPPINSESGALVFGSVIAESPRVGWKVTLLRCAGTAGTRVLSRAGG